MKSIREIFKVGKGPSSSHTMGPEKASKIFKEEYPEAESYKVMLYDSLAKTGKGHMTDKAILNILGTEKTEIVWVTNVEGLPHPNTMDFIAYKDGKSYGEMRVISIGGGDIIVQGRDQYELPNVYEEESFTQIAEYCKKNNMRLSDYVELKEGKEIWEFLFEIWQVMKRAIADGLSTSGVLEGGIGVERKAQYLYNQRHIDESAETYEDRIVCAYAFAVSEQNASCGTIVTAPTCGACGVLPSVLKYMQEKKNFTEEQILRAIAVAGLIGNLVKTNASISGAECGCQAEIGTACSMTSAALGELYGMGIDQIEYAAEVALEHHLGLTCDPICGLVQIPCIERNAVAAMRAINALRIANFLTSTRKISFDMVVKTMYETGHDMSPGYRETSEAGLANLNI